jgi:hypothetical protein
MKKLFSKILVLGLLLSGNAFPSFANAQIIEIGMCYRIENYNNGVFKDYWNLEDHNKSNTLYYKFLDKPTKRNNQYWSLWEGEWGTDNEDIKDLKEQGYKSVKMYEKTIITINLSNNTIIKLKVLTDDLLNHYSNVYSKLYDLKKKYPNKWRSTGGFLDNDEEDLKFWFDKSTIKMDIEKFKIEDYVGGIFMGRKIPIKYIDGPGIKVDMDKLNFKEVTSYDYINNANAGFVSLCTDNYKNINNKKLNKKSNSGIKKLLKKLY